MTRGGWIVRTLAVAVLATLAAAQLATAQASRTWVSGVGDDINPCSRTAPCKTFAGAISKTAPKGEINCLDSGGFGAVTITKSITIHCEGSVGGILASLVSGIIVNAAATDTIVISGLDIEGFGNGLNGIRFLAGGALHVRNTTIRGFNSASAGSGHGIDFEPSVASRLFLDNVDIENCGTGTNGGGVLIKPTATGSATAVIRNSTIARNVFGVKVESTSANAVRLDIHDSATTQSAFSGLTANGSLGSAQIFADRVNSTHNGTTGLQANGSLAVIRVANSTIYNNATGMQVTAGAAMISNQGNHVRGNGTDGTFTSTDAAQ
jgi:hypothetical protein